MVAVDARGPKFDGGIVTRITAIPHGIVVDRDGKRFHDEGEDARKTHFARWGARIAECPEQIAYLILDANGLGRALPTALAPIRADSIAALATSAWARSGGAGNDGPRNSMPRRARPAMAAERTSDHRAYAAENPRRGRAHGATLRGLSAPPGRDLHAFRCCRR